MFDFRTDAINKLTGLYADSLLDTDTPKDKLLITVAEYRQDIIEDSDEELFSALLDAVYVLGWDDHQKYMVESAQLRYPDSIPDEV